MIDLSPVLTELLFDRDAVIVPGLGRFSRQDDSAKVNVITNHFERPSSSISFDPRQREENDLLAKAIETREGCSAAEARQQVAQFVSDCFETFKQGGIVTLTGLGTLSMDNGETLSFEQEQGLNLNGDAFGLGDFDPTPVHESNADNDWREQVIKQNKDKNTPMTVDRRSMDYEYDEEDYYRHRRKVIRNTLITLLLAIPVVLALLHFMEIIHLKSPFPIRPGGSAVYDFPISETTPVKTEAATTLHLDSALLSTLVRYDVIPDAMKNPAFSASVETTDAQPETVLPATADTQPELETQEVTESPSAPASSQEPEPQTVTQPEEAPATQPASSTLRYSIIGGCFSQKENADNLVASLLEEGYSQATVMPRGKQYYVCYARFATLKEAKEALEKVRVNSNNKAWILDK